MSQAATDISFEARSNSVKQLCDLYRVVIALAVGVAFNGIIDTKVQPIPINPDLWKTFAALLITIIPFFHGAVRHLFATYVEGGGSTKIKNWAILIDYYILFLEGGLFVGLASTLGNADSFLALYVILLAVDSIWGILATIGFAGSSSQKAEMKWACINFAAFVLAVALYVVHPAMVSAGMAPDSLQTLLLLVALVRSAVDYLTSIHFYCP